MTGIGALTLTKVFMPAAVTFAVGMFLTPFFLRYFHKHRMWKRVSRKEGGVSELYKELHNEKEELSTPRIGGVIVWVSVALVVLLFALIAGMFPGAITDKLNFLSREQTYIPFFALIAAALIGLGDDLLQIYGFRGYTDDDIAYRKVKAGLIVFIGIVIALWFVFKLGVTSVYLPFYGPVEIGMIFIPFFILVMLATFSTSVIDGMDGLSAGVIAPVFVGYAIIAFFNNQVDLAAFCSAVSGGLLAFLWFNIPPARFYMGETGMLALTVAISVLAFLTDTVFILPIIALPLVATSFSVIVQLLSRRYRKKKVFRVAPLHHHFEALGWSRYKIVMRYWVIAMVSVVVGVILAILSK